MSPKDRDKYFKLVALIVDIACLVIWQYITKNVLGSDTFEAFLNKKKHILVHVHESSQYCECERGKLTGNRLISRKQLLILYKSEERNQIHEHTKYKGGKLTQICICNYSAKENANVKLVDITLAKHIIKKCGKHEPGADNWIDQIIDVRNEIFHLSDLQEITDVKFTRTWQKLEGSILGIASLVGSTYAKDIEKRILQTKKLTIIADYILKYEIMCRDYWRNKCAEFEVRRTCFCKTFISVNDSSCYLTIYQSLREQKGTWISKQI